MCISLVNKYDSTSICSIQRLSDKQQYSLIIQLLDDKPQYFLTCDNQCIIE